MATEKRSVVVEKNDSTSKSNIFENWFFELAPVSFFAPKVSDANKAQTVGSADVPRVVFGSCTT